MSGFGGHMRAYRQISIDRFDKTNLKSTVFLLSHCHRDHMIGLDHQNFLRCLQSRNGIFLYCSEVTKLLLLSEEFKSLACYIRVLEMGVPTTVPIPDPDSDEFKSVVVTTLPAGHCPGSVMFLIEGKEGRALYTGDFRWEKNYATTLPALCVNGHMKEIDSMYVDTTFCIPEAFCIPPRDDCLSATASLVVSWLQESPNRYVHVSSNTKYGHEPLLAHLAKEAKTKVHTTAEKVKIYEQITELRGIFTNDQSAKIHTCRWMVDRSGESRLPCGYTPKRESSAESRESPEVLVIRPSTMWFTNVPSRLQELVVAPAPGRGLHRVCYSFHSSYSELRDLVSLLRPRQVFPNVLPASDTDWNQVNERLQKFLTYRHKYHMTPEGDSDVAKPLGLLKRKRRESVQNLTDSEGLVFDSPEKPKQFFDSPEKPKRARLDSNKDEVLQSSQKSAASSIISPTKSDTHSSYRGSDLEEDMFAYSDEEEEATLQAKGDAEAANDSQSLRSYVSGDEEVPEDDRVSSLQFRHFKSRDDLPEDQPERCLDDDGLGSLALGDDFSNLCGEHSDSEKESYPGRENSPEKLSNSEKQHSSKVQINLEKQSHCEKQSDPEISTDPNLTQLPSKTDQHPFSKELDEPDGENTDMSGRSGKENSERQCPLIGLRSSVSDSSMTERGEKMEKNITTSVDGSPQQKMLPCCKTSDSPEKNSMETSDGDISPEVKIDVGVNSAATKNSWCHESGPEIKSFVNGGSADGTERNKEYVTHHEAEPSSGRSNANVSFFDVKKVGSETSYKLLNHAGDESQRCSSCEDEKMHVLSTGNIEKTQLCSLERSEKAQECSSEDGKKTEEEAGNGKKTEGEAGNDKKTEEEAGHGKKTEEEAGNDKKTEEEAGSGKKTEEEAGNDKKTEGEAGNGKKTEGEAGSGKKTEEEAGNDEKTEEEAGNDKKTEEEAGNGKKTEGEAGNDKKMEEEAGNGKRTEEEAGNDKKTEEEAGNGKKTEEEAGNDEKTEEEAGNGKKTKEEAGNDKKTEGEAENAQKSQQDSLADSQQETNIISSDSDSDVDCKITKSFIRKPPVNPWQKFYHTSPQRPMPHPACPAHCWPGPAQRNFIQRRVCFVDTGTVQKFCPKSPGSRGNPESSASRVDKNGRKPGANKEKRSESIDLTLAENDTSADLSETNSCVERAESDISVKLSSEEDKEGHKAGRSTPKRKRRTGDSSCTEDDYADIEDNDEMEDGACAEKTRAVSHASACKTIIPCSSNTLQQSSDVIVIDDEAHAKPSDDRRIDCVSAPHLTSEKVPNLVHRSLCSSQQLRTLGHCHGVPLSHSALKQPLGEGTPTASHMDSSPCKCKTSDSDCRSGPTQASGKQTTSRERSPLRKSLAKDCSKTTCRREECLTTEVDCSCSTASKVKLGTQEERKELCVSGGGAVEAEEAVNAPQLGKPEETVTAEQACNAEEANTAEEVKKAKQTDKPEDVYKAEKHVKAEEALEAVEAKKAEEADKPEQTDKADNSEEADCTEKAEQADTAKETYKADEVLQAKQADTGEESGKAGHTDGDRHQDHASDNGKTEGEENRADEDSDATLPPSSVDSTLHPDSPVAVYSSDSDPDNDCRITHSFTTRLPLGQGLPAVCRRHPHQVHCPVFVASPPKGHGRDASGRSPHSFQPLGRGRCQQHGVGRTQHVKGMVRLPQSDRTAVKADSASTPVTLTKKTQPSSFIDLTEDD